jgi:hypothetical protein
MKMETDPQLAAMFDNDQFDEEEAKKRDFDPKYGVGRWANAILREVETQEANDFGHSITLKVDLKGDEGMAFTFFVDAPSLPEENGDPDVFEKAQKRYSICMNRLKTLIHATGQWVQFNEKGYKASTIWPASLLDFSTDESYAKLVNTFAQLVGRKMGLNVKVDSYTKQNGETGYRKNVWGLDPRQSKDKIPF